MAVFIGSLLPDAFIYVAWVYYMMRGETQSQIWDVLYFQNPVQFWDAFFNSFPLYALIAALGWRLTSYDKGRLKWLGECLIVFGLAALIHLSFDFPVHASDAHRHFWPVTDWRFYSPLSYWETDHHALWVGLCDAGLGIAAAAILWRRFPARWVKVLLSLLFLVYAAMIIFTLLFITGILGNGG